MLVDKSDLGKPMCIYVFYVPIRRGGQVALKNLCLHKTSTMNKVYTCAYFTIYLFSNRLFEGAVCK